MTEPLSEIRKLSALARRLERRLTVSHSEGRFIAEMERAIYEGRITLPDEWLGAFPKYEAET